MNTEFFTALDLLEKERGVPAAYMMEKIEAALISAYKKEYGNNTNVRILIDPNKKDVKVYQQKEVVEVVENPETQISLADAKAKEELVAKAIETVRDDARLASLEKNIEKMGKPNAAEEIAEEVLMLADAYMEKETRRKKENLK